MINIEKNKFKECFLSLRNANSCLKDHICKQKKKKSDPSLKLLIKKLWPSYLFINVLLYMF